MARTINEIYDEIITEKQAQTQLNALQPAIDNSQTLLDDLTSTSKVAVWRLIFWITAVALWVHENIFDRFQATVEAKASDLIVATDRWVQLRCFDFQFGYQLQFIDEQYQYSIVDESAKIIQAASVITLNSQSQIKVAKDDGSGGLTALDSTEKSAFNSYINQITPVGTNIAVISEEGDDLVVNYDIVYNPLILDSNGESLETPGTFPVQDAINAYLGSLPFNGVLNMTALTDQIQQVNGVLDPVLNSAQAKLSSSATFNTIDKNYIAGAGYLKLDASSVFNYELTNV